MNLPTRPALFFRTIFGFRVCVTVILLLLAGLLARFPAHNGDMPFYIAAVFSGEGSGDSSSLSRAASEIRSSLPVSEAAIHLEHLANAPENFLDFYRMKAGYTAVIAGLHSAGFSYVVATVVPSLIAFFFLGYGVFMWAGNMFPHPASILIGSFLLIFTGAMQLGRLSTPDAVSACLLFWAIIRIRFSKRPGLTMLLLFIALSFRPDNLPAISGLLILMRWGYQPTTGSAFNRLSLGRLMLALSAAVVLFFLINAWSEPRFWWFRPVPYPGITNYHDPARLTHFVRLLAGSPVPVLVSLAAIVIAYQLQLYRIEKAILLYLIIMLPVRYMLFPYYEARFYTPFYLAGFCILIGVLGSSKRVTMKNE